MALIPHRRVSRCSAIQLFFLLLLLLLGRGGATGGETTDESWWAIQPLNRPEIPKSTSAQPGWSEHPIDRFVAAKHAEKSLLPTPAADRRTFIRRATFDLTGLPPTPEEVNAFVNDNSPNATKRLVDRLLSSPRYGERWARHWMDVAHYAETHGHDEDAIRENAWPYRDFLIESFNNDKPYAKFVREQIAGDVLFPEEPSATRGIGFLATGPWDESSQMGISDGTIDKKIAQYLDRDDMIATVMSTFVSTTVHCARCHDHKFDPVSMEDYYSLQAVFAGVDKVDRPYDADARLAKRRTLLNSRQRTLDQGKIPEGMFTAADLAKLEAELHRSQAKWAVLSPATVESSSGIEYEAKPDGSFLALGQAPEKDTTTFTAQLPIDGGTALQLELLTHESLPKSGPGRADNGNLHLSKILVRVNGDRVKIARAEANFNQDGWTIAHAIDANPDSAWGIHPKEGQTHRALFVFEKPLAGIKGDEIRVELRQLHGRKHLIGRPRLKLTNFTLPSVVESVSLQIKEILAINPQKRSQEQKHALAFYFAKAVNERAMASLGAQNKVYAVASQFAALGNFKPAEKPRVVHVLQRGSIHSPGNLAQPGALSCVSGLDNRFTISRSDSEEKRRAALANWLADERNVLLWRSIVNRVWHYHFGRGIVGTPNDFGRMGDRPSHPALLDWLAYEFRARGGSLKWLHRTIMTSSVYLQQSAYNAGFAKRDTDNRWLWRMNRKRLDAESYRDAVLQLAGNMNLKMGGPSDRQFNMSKGVHVTPNLDYVGFDPDAPANHRRSVYRFVFRTIPDPLMQLMDCPDASQHAPKRESSVTALQALGMLNNRFLVRQGERLAERLQRESPTPEAQIKRLFELAYHREPTTDEDQLVSRLAREHGLANACRVVLNSNEFLFVN
ncbi:MAG: DUF1549 and DUF1553 domain-containing protein [Verrucomicrobiota bacterium]|nr:DUF1549 and DUF1553 domain-containing protein [Verrucomicrobiota bacterium]